MVLVVDVGNTNINFGVFREEELIVKFRLVTKLERTSDEYGIAITDLLKLNGVDYRSLEGCMVASVVPNVMHALLGALERYVKVNPMTVGPGTKTGLKIVTPNPREIGADRIVDAVAAYERYGGPVLAIDFGTATTYDLISANAEFVAGITAPGLKISAKALWEDTARLPEVELKKPDSILAQETISSMQAGLIYGQIGQTEYIVKCVREESGYTKMHVVATGGLGRIISDETKEIEVYDRNLTLEGLKLIYNKNRK